MKKKNRTYRNAQKIVEKEAYDLIIEYYKNRFMPIQRKELMTSWYALHKNGWQIMVSSTRYPNQFFQIRKNCKSGEICCSCFDRYEFISIPGNINASSAMIDSLI